MHEVHGDTVTEAKIATNLTDKEVVLDGTEVKDLGKLKLNGIEYVFQKSGGIFSFSSVSQTKYTTNMVNHVFETKEDLTTFIEKLKEGL